MSDIPIEVVITDPPQDPVQVVIGDASAAVSNARIAQHKAEAEPHDAYDDMQSLSLIFENGLF